MVAESAQYTIACFRWLPFMVVKRMLVDHSVAHDVRIFDLPITPVRPHEVNAATIWVDVE